MKVTKIETRQRKADNSTYYRLTLEGLELPVLQDTKPSFKEGDELPYQPEKAYNNKYYLPPKDYIPVSPSAETPAQGEAPRGKKPADNWESEIWTTKRCCLMQAVDLTKTYMEPQMGLAEAVKCVIDTTTKLFVMAVGLHADKEKK